MAEIATVAQIAGVDSLKLITLIVTAARNARMHRKNCRKFAQHLKLIGGLLEQLKVSELREHSETSEPLERLEESLRRAYVLVDSCKNKSYLYLLAMGWNIVNQFKLRQAEIDRLLHLIPLITLVENNRAEHQLKVIENDLKEYTLDDQEVKLQQTVLKNDLTPTESRELQKSLSRSYPGLSIEAALKKENTKLRKELEHMQSLIDMDPEQRNVIERLIDITETDVKSMYEKDPDFIKSTKEYRQSKTSPISYEEDHGGPRPPQKASSESWQLRNWRHDLFGCCTDPLLCIGTFICPCWTFSTIAATATDGIMPKHAACTNCLIYTLVLSCCFYTCCFRRKLRKRYNIEGGSCDDCWAHSLCFCCALVQEAREIKSREKKRCESQKTIVAPSEQSMERD